MEFLGCCIRLRFKIHVHGNPYADYDAESANYAQMRRRKETED